MTEIIIETKSKSIYPIDVVDTFDEILELLVSAKTHVLYFKLTDGSHLVFMPDSIESVRECLRGDTK